MSPFFHLHLTLLLLFPPTKKLTPSLPEFVGNNPWMRELLLDNNALSGLIARHGGGGGGRRICVRAVTDAGGDGAARRRPGRSHTLTQTHPLSQQQQTPNTTKKGTVPDSFSSPTLAALILSDNQFVGPLPPSLGFAASVREYRVSGNQLTGLAVGGCFVALFVRVLCART